MAFGGGGGVVAKLWSTLAATWTVAFQALLSMGFSRHKYWVAISFSRESSQPRDRTHIFCIARRFFPAEKLASGAGYPFSPVVTTYKAPMLILIWGSTLLPCVLHFQFFWYPIAYPMASLFNPISVLSSPQSLSPLECK